MRTQLYLALAGALCALVPARASTSLELLPDQVGGFYDGGAAPDNMVGFQNYFVGYGTSPGGSRTPERRSFFVFDFSGVGGTIDSATLKLRLPFGGLVFGKGPGTPPAPIPDDPSEVFALGYTPFSSALVTSSGLAGDPTLTDTLFETFDDHPVASPFVFMSGVPLPSDAPHSSASLVSIVFDAAGLAVLNAAVASGSPLVLTGWMPSWSLDTRPAPPGSPVAFLESSELIFGFTDVVSPGSGAHPELAPTLDLVITPIPEPTATAALLAGGAALFSVWRRRKASA